MSRRDTLFLGVLGFLILLGIAAFEQVPGYMDADYYLATGKQIAAGNGFIEPFLWNYLDDPDGLPHPSHTYWMPLVSLLAALLPSLSGLDSWWATRIPFLLIGAFIPPVTASLAYSVTSRRPLALTSGVLAAFSGFYLPFLPTTDTFALYILTGGLFLSISIRYFTSTKPSLRTPLYLGILAGLMHLARADGLTWLLIAFLIIFISPGSGSTGWKKVLDIARGISIILLGYLAIMGPWFVRNAVTIGNILAPGGMKMLWLTSYNQIFSFPATGISPANWIQSGLGAIFKARAWSLGMNLATTLAVQGGIILLPFILIGIYRLRHEKAVLIAIAAWSLTLIMMTIAFPYAGARGGFFHSGAALQMMWWVVAPVGLEVAVHRISKWRRWQEQKAQATFRAGMIVLIVVISAFVLLMRLPGWGDEAANYTAIHQFLIQKKIPAGDVIIVSNPPGFYLVSSRPSIVLPDGTPETILALAEQYKARYLVLEPGSITTGLQQVYDQPDEFPYLLFLGEVDGTRIFAIEP